MTYRRLIPPSHSILGQIHLPASKSECNRALIIQALAQYQSGCSIELENISTARDSQTLQELLKLKSTTLDVKDAGTTMRFLSAFLALTQEERVLTGTARMKQRPIGILVEALREIGFIVDYLEEEGFPPLAFKKSPPKQVLKEQVSIRGDVSSQFISALLMIAPLLPKGLKVKLLGKVSSRPYINMTLKQMEYFGIRYTWREDEIHIEAQEYQSARYPIESDWSGASYWYSLVALSEGSEVKLMGLQTDSWQGDSKIVQIMADLGVQSKFESDGIRINSLPHFIPKAQEIDFSTCPDLAQTVLVIAAAKRIPLTARGLESLRIKETDRIAALQHELAKLGVELREEYAYWSLIFDEWADAKAKSNKPDKALKIKTYEDHRMAMAFAPLALRYPIKIEEPSVVAKSYPSFWEDLAKVGFTWTDE